ncbi:MAG TPA: NAD(P)-dependent oxidoreductase [Leucothrix mucor]|nr:NAD(P)-dependent oxidoreductase [Leucothrix mucor]
MHIKQTENHKKEKPRITFIGLGAMGFPMAGHLSKAGFDVTVFNRTQSKTEAWLKQYAGQKSNTITQAARSADIVFSCVGNDSDVREIYAEIFKTAKATTILVDHTTTSAQLARELATTAKQKGLTFIDAPVSGGQVGAEQGALTIMAGGDKTSFERITPIINHYAKAVTLVGEVGAGQTCKMVNQLCVAGVLQGLSEGLNLAKASGINADTILNVLQHGAASSWQMINRTETMMNNEFDFGFAIDWMRKDLAICFDEAEKLGIELPMSKLVDERYAQLQKKGYSRSDTSVLIKQFDKDLNKNR